MVRSARVTAVIGRVPATIPAMATRQTIRKRLVIVCSLLDAKSA
jgi:hypothetical protein